MSDDSFNNTDNFEKPEESFSPLPGIETAAGSDSPQEEGIHHCKVPRIPWYAETWVFYKRYFSRLLLMGLVLGLLALAASFFTKTENSDLPSVDTAAEAADSDVDFFADTDDADAEKADNEDSANTEETDDEKADMENAESEDGTKAADAEDTGTDDETEGAAENETADESRESLCQALSETSVSGPGLIFLALETLFGWFFLRWTIQTLKTDKASARNLCLPSCWTVLKLIAAGILLGLYAFVLIFAAGCIFGAVSLCGIASIIAASITVLTILIFAILLSFSIYTHLILDQNCGAFKSLTLSRAFMRNNKWTFFRGLLRCFFLYIALAVILQIPIVAITIPKAVSLMNSGVEPQAARTAIMQMLGDSQFYFWTQKVSTLVGSALLGSYMMVLTSVFYLMATGQRRPGAWERDGEIAAETAKETAE